MMLDAQQVHANCNYLPDGTYWLDTGYACGAITFKNKKIVPNKTAPIFRRIKYISKFAKFKKIN